MTQPGLAACVFLGKLAMGTNVRSSAVWASGRYRLLVSTPRNTISPASGRGAKSTKSWRRRWASIWPSSSASYKLAQLRSKKGENDNSGKLRAAASLESASTRLHRASLALPKQRYIPSRNAFSVLRFIRVMLLSLVLVDTLLPLSNPCEGIAELTLV